MTVSNLSARRLIPALVLVLAPAWGLSPAQAQETLDQPLQLTPPTELLLDPETGPMTGPKADSADLPAGEAADPAAPQGLEGIEISRLTEIDPEAVGILDPADGGLGSDLWAGSRRRTVERLLPHLPAEVRSPTMRDLAHRLLLSNAAPPPEEPGATAPRKSNLLALRIDRLAAMGDFAGLSGLLEVVPQRYDDEAVARARFEALLLQNRTQPACQEARYRISSQDGSLYWRKALIFCQTLNGESEQAALGIALLREQGLDDDPLFFALADSLTGAHSEAPGALPESPLHLAMLRATGQPLPVALLHDAGPGLLISFVDSEVNELEDRVAVAEQALELGLLAPEKLTALYGAYAFEPEQLAGAITEADRLSGAERRALLYQAARAQPVPAARAEVLRVALDGAWREGRDYDLTVRVLEPLLSELPHQPELAWFAATAGRALLAAERFEAAAAWLQLVRQQALVDPQAAQALDALWPYGRLTSGDAFAWEGSLADWAAARDEPDPALLAQRQLLLRTAFQALGEGDPLAWTDLIGTAGSPTPAGGAPDAAVLYALGDASRAGRRGETVLLTLLALGEAGPARSHPLVLHEVLAALGRVELGGEARRLAIEAALANGV